MDVVPGHPTENDRVAVQFQPAFPLIPIHTGHPDTFGYQTVFLRHKDGIGITHSGARHLKCVRQLAAGNFHSAKHPLHKRQPAIFRLCGNRLDPNRHGNGPRFLIKRDNAMQATAPDMTLFIFGPANSAGDRLRLAEPGPAG